MTDIASAARQINEQIAHRELAGTIDRIAAEPWPCADCPLHSVCAATRSACEQYWRYVAGEPWRGYARLPTPWRFEHLDDDPVQRRPRMSKTAAQRRASLLASYRKYIGAEFHGRTCVDVWEGRDGLKAKMQCGCGRSILMPASEIPRYQKLCPCQTTKARAANNTSRALRRAEREYRNKKIKGWLVTGFESAEHNSKKFVVANLRCEHCGRTHQHRVQYLRKNRKPRQCKCHGQQPHHGQG